jgi:hypothetical protein
MECAEMNGNFRAEIVDNPFGHCVELIVRIVFSGDEKRRDFEPDIGLVLEIDERFENVVQFPDTKLLVKTIGERFEIDIGGIHVPEKLATWFLANIPGRYGHRLYPCGFARLRDIDGVFEKYHRIVIRERDAPASQRPGRPGDLIRGRFIGKRVYFPRLADIPVLTELAREIAARRSE